MKNFVFYIFTIASNCFFGQLPPNAQAIYDSALAQDPAVIDYALTNGAEIIATDDGNSFYIKWFPSSSIPSETPVIVSLHGSNGYAFHEFYNWHSSAQLKGCGIIALQWYRPTEVTPQDYFSDDLIYRFIDSALTRINYPSNKAFLHGFSRGSARSYAVIFNDIQQGKNYFCTTLSNAGSLDLLYPLYADLDSGVYGTNVFEGKKWNLFCGGLDTNIQSTCDAMSDTKNWLLEQGASVDIFIQDSNLEHNGFQLQSSFYYKDSILDNYLSCFNSVSVYNENFPDEKIRFSPNPFSFETKLKLPYNFQNTTFSLYNTFGKELSASYNLSDNEIIFYRSNLQSGIYFLEISNENQRKQLLKLVISD